MLSVALGISLPAAADIQAGLWLGRVDTTTSVGGKYRTWSSDAQNGDVLSRVDLSQADGTSHWTDHGSGSAPAGSKGVAATGYFDGTNYHEWVVYVGTDGNLNFGELVNGGPITWTYVPPPTGRTLTGHIVAITFVQSSARYIFVGATTTDGHLYRYVAGVPGLFFGGWADSSGSLSWSTDSQLGASASPNETIASVFAAHTPGAEKLGMVRWSGSAWSTNNLGGITGRRMCRSIASAQMSPSGLAGDERVLIACAPHDFIGGVDIATTTLFSSTSFTWATYDTSHYYQTVAALAHSTNLIRRTFGIDTYGSTLFSNDIAKGTYDGTTYSATNLGIPSEGIGPTGGMGVAPYGTTTRLFYVATQNGRNYLYERYGGSTSSAPQNYRQLADEADFTVPGAVSDHYAEGKISIWQGTAAASVINRPGTGGPTDWPQVYFLYSPDEFKTLPPAVQVPSTVNVPQLGGSTTFPYVSDPTTAVTDQRTMYSFQIGINTTSCSPSGSSSINGSSIYMTTTTPSTFPTWSTPVSIQGGTGNQLDHPYADIQHRYGLPDIINVAWWRLSSGTEYSAVVEGSAPTAPSLIGTYNGPPRVTASDSGRTIVYVPLDGLGSVAFCEMYDKIGGDGIPDTCCINGTTCGTTAGWQTIDVSAGTGNPALAWSTRGHGPEVSATAGTYIQDEYPVSMAISESGDALYYCYDKLETTGVGKDNVADAFCSVGIRNPSTGQYAWKTPIAVASVTNDDKDQFMPEVALTQETSNYGTGETAIVTWYDRTDDPANYLYKVKKTISTDRMTTVLPAREQFNGITSDPEYLPRHCFHPYARFIGDYAGTEGYTSHAQIMSVTVRSFSGSIGTGYYASSESLGSWEK